MINDMNKAAVLHVPVSQFAFAIDTSTITVRLRCAKGDLDKVELIWADRCSETNPITSECSEMICKWQNKEFDYYEIVLTNIPDRFCYYFKLYKNEEWTYYYSERFTDEKADIILQDGSFVEGRSGYYQYPMILRSEVQYIPEWFLHSTVYNIFPDSFANSKRGMVVNEKIIKDENSKQHQSRLGGTIKGIMENLDYIKEMGFDCIYLNPIFSAGEYHKYDIIDYYHVDPVLGTDVEFVELVEKVHSLEMRIIIDGVFNHMGWNNDIFLDVVKNGEKSIYKDWFYDLKFPVRIPAQGEKPDYYCFAYEKKMPKLNTANEEVQNYFARVGAHWIERFHVDGWRLDVANEVDKNFWRCFKKAVHKANPDAVLVGEVWENAADWLESDMFDSVMNYDFRKHCVEYFAMSKITSKQFVDDITSMWLRYSSTFSRGQLNLLDSHDVARFLSMSGNEISRLKAAIAFLFFFPGVPSLFYGDELEIFGVVENEYRKPMAWNNEDCETRALVKKLLNIRKDWISAESDFELRVGETQPEILLLDRIQNSTIRLVFNASNECVDISNYTKYGLVLLGEKMQNDYLESFGFCIIKL